MLPVLLPIPPADFPSRSHSVYTHHPKHRSHPEQALLLTRTVTAGSLIPQTTSLHAPRATPFSSGRLAVGSTLCLYSPRRAPQRTLCLYSPSRTQITPGAGTSAHPLRDSRESHTANHLPACSPCYSLFLPLAFRPDHTLSILTIPNTDHTRSRHFRSPAPC